MIRIILKNQILYTLNYLGYDFHIIHQILQELKIMEFIVTDGIHLEEYIQDFLTQSKTRTIGILESTMYIDSQQLHPRYSIIESLESKGYNVIPVFAAGGSAEQLKVMVESWTSAGDDIAGFLENPQIMILMLMQLCQWLLMVLVVKTFTKATDFLKKLEFLFLEQFTQIMFQMKCGN